MSASGKSATPSKGKAGAGAPPRKTGSSPHLDIPPRTRNVLIVISLAGMICAVIGSLMAKKGVAVEADKIVHFCGYSLLSILMVMGLRPILWPFGLVAVAGMSATLEAIQPIFGRSTDWSGDFVTNCIAVAVGGVMGMLGRFLWAYLRTEAVNSEIRKATLGFADGQVIFKQGEPSDKFYIVRSGQVVISREVRGESSEIAKAGPGEVVGEMGVLQNLPRSATATAKGRCWLYGMTLQDLTDKRSDGQDHPGSVVARVLAQRLRKTTEKVEQLEYQNAQVPAAVPAVASAASPARPGPGQAVGPKLLLRLGWRKGEEVSWGEEVSEHSFPVVFGRSPGPTGYSARTEMVLMDEKPPYRLAPLQFLVEVRNGAVILRDELSETGNEVSGVSVGPAVGVTEVELPAGPHVLVAGGEGSPFVMALEVPHLG